MDKKEFMAMSLPYGLKVKYITDIIRPYSSIMYESEFEDSIVIKSKPVLRPLSDLTKEIHHGGETFIPAGRLVPESFGHIQNREIGDFLDRNVVIILNVDTDEQLHIYTDNGISISTRKHRFNVSDFRIIKLLVIWHFDIAGLIDKNEAINCNSIKNFNYYE